MSGQSSITDWGKSILVSTSNPRVSYDKDQWWTQTPKDEVEMCLNCTRPKCIDCLSRVPKKYNNQHKIARVDVEKFIYLYNSGESGTNMGELLGVSKWSIFTWARYMGLSLHPTYRDPISLEFIKAQPHHVKIHFTLKGVALA